MKELTIEEKAKAYDKALKRVEAILKVAQNQTEIYNCIITILPELKSEFERIRTSIIDIFSGNKSFTTLEERIEYIAWLKNLSEKSQYKNREDEKIRTAILKGLIDCRDAPDLGWSNFGGITIDECIAWLEDCCDTSESNLNDFENKELNKIEGELAWSEEDEVIYAELIKFFEAKLNCLATEERHNENRKWLNWLKSLKNRVQPQNLTVTDEELAQAKKDAYNDALDKIEYHSGEPTFDDGWSAAIWYLKKRTTQPQSTWKPSEEQMEALTLAIHDVHEMWYKKHLLSLKQQLKQV